MPRKASGPKLTVINAAPAPEHPAPPGKLVHRSRQKIHRSATLHAAVAGLQPCQGADHVNHLNASVH